jgi:hypothetical protein
MIKSHEEEEESEGSYFCNPTTCCSTDELSTNLDDSNSNYSNFSNLSDYQTSEFDHSHNILSTTPLSTTSSMLSDDDVHEIMSTTHRNCYNNYKNRRNSIINQRLAEISGIYSVQEVNQMEREFLKYLGHHNNWVSDKDIREFVENNKYALGIC